MSELAFNLNGEPFDLPLTAIGWRVRKFKSKGAPEVVYGRQGTPLVLPIDAEMDDLRREARSEGRYRLDAIDENNRPIGGAPPAYVCIHPDEVAVPDPTPAQVRNLPPPGPDHALVEAMRVNSDLARTVIEKFPLMLESAAVLLRAADNAGMPARPPRPFELVMENDDDDDNDDEEPEAPPPAKQGGVMGFMEMLLDKLAPEIVRAVLAGKLQVPGGLGALLDGRRAVVTTDAAETHTASTPAVGPAPGRRVSAPAASSRASRPASVTKPHGVSTEPRAVAAPTGTSTASAAPEGLPTIDEVDLSHFTAILDALSLRERMYAQALVAELSPAELRAWVAELKQVPVNEAVTKIRTVLGAEPTEASAAPSDDPGIPTATNGRTNGDAS
jgi:hypothetical protein